MFDKKKLAIIDNAIEPDIYTPVAHWSQFINAEWEAFTATLSEFPDPNAGFTHVILTGSEASIMQREAWVDLEIEIVHEFVKKDIPILGSCYGHQLLAIALTGPEYVQRCSQPEIGWLPIEIIRPSELLGPPGISFMYTLHFDEVISPGDEFEVLASTELCKIHAFKKKNKPFWGIQAHPEIDIQAGKQLLDNLRALKTREEPLYTQAMNSVPQDSGIIQRIIKVFLQS